MTEELKKLRAEISLNEGIIKNCDDAIAEANNERLMALRANESLRRKMAALTPVDRSQVALAGGHPVTADHKDLKENGQQRGYLVLTPEERAKGLVRPVRSTYMHKTCNTETIMARDIAETYARDPGFYSGGFCVKCRDHFPNDQFVWAGTTEQVGS